MAGRPDIDTGQLQKADKIMSDIVSKFDMLARFDEIPALKLLPDQLDNVDKKLAGINKAVGLISKSGQKKWKVFTDAIKENRKEIESIAKRYKHYADLQNAGIKLSKREIFEMEEMRKQMKLLNRELKEQLDVRKAMLKLAGQEGMKFLDWFGGSVVSMSFSTVFAGMKLLATGIEKVYDLQEKWTHAIGTFRKAIGPATKDSKLFEKAAADMHFQLFDLGMGFDAAHQEMAGFVKGFGFANDEASKWAKQAVQFGVVTGAGTEGIAELSRNMMLMGVEQQKQKGYFAEMIGAANAAGVSVSEFTREIVGSKDSLAEFGETGQKMFMNAASWARKLGVSIKSLQNIIKLTDTFSSTAEAAAKMNTVFGTSINSMDLMLEQDPAKRFNMLRDSLIGVGKDMKNLSRLEKKLIADTLQMSMEETNAFLKSGKDYNTFMDEKQKREKEAAAATANMNKYMRLASTTMYEWAALAERVIRKFEPLVNVFLEGLIPGFNGIGSAASKVGSVVERTFDQIFQALNKEEMKKSLRDLGGTIRKIFSEVLTPDNINRVVTGLSNLFTKFSAFTAEIARITAGPAFKALVWLFEKIGQYGHIVGGAFAGAKVGAALGPLGMLGGAITGGGAAAMLGDKTTSGNVTSALGEMQLAEINAGGSPWSAERWKAEEAKYVAAQTKPEGREAGGPVRAHTPYIVGEKGPEGFVPQTNGTIVPNGGGFLPVHMTMKVMLDSREIQRIPFDTTLPINVSVVGA